MTCCSRASIRIRYSFSVPGTFAWGHHPGDGRLGRGQAELFGLGAQDVRERQVLLEVLALEPRAVAAEIAGPADVRGVATEQAAGQHAIGGDRDAEPACDAQDL